MNRLFVQRALWVNLFLCLAWATADDASIEQGRQLYLTAGGYGCHVCHGLVANGAGQAGGAIRGATLAAFDASLLSNPPMQPLDEVLTLAEKQAITDYLLSLAQLPLVELKYDQQQWWLTGSDFKAGQTVELFFYNASFDAQQLDLNALGLGIISLEPLASSSLRWLADRSTLVLPDVNLGYPDA